MLKIKLTEKEWKTKPEAIQAEYKKKKEGDEEFYELDHDGVYEDDVEKVRQAKENEVKEHKKTKTELKDLRTKYTELEGEKTKSSDDVKAAETKLTEKHTAELTKRDTRIASLRKATETSMREAAEASLASELFKDDASAKLGRPHLRDRIRVDWTEDDEKGDIAKVVYLDDKGQEASREKVAKNLSTQEIFKGILKGTQASGAGNSPGSGPVDPPGGLPPVPPTGQNGRQAWQTPTDQQLLAGVEAMNKQ